MRLTLLAAASAALLAAGGCGDGATDPLELPKGPVAVARAYYDGLTACDRRKAAVAYALWEEPLVRDRGSWVETTVENCRENVPRGSRRITAQVLERTPDAAVVRVLVTWVSGGSAGDRFGLVRTDDGWRIAGPGAAGER